MPFLDEPGVWWRTSDPDNRLPGILQMDGNVDPVLRLIGGFELRIMQLTPDGSLTSHGELRAPGTIHGEASGKSITLFGSSTAGQKGGLLGRPHEHTLAAAVTLVGQHVVDPFSEFVAGAEVHVENLTVWAGRTAIRAQMMMEDSGHWTGRSRIDVVATDDDEVVIPGARLYLKHVFNPLDFENSTAKRTVSIREYCYVKFEFDNPVSLETYDRYVSDLQDLITFCVDRPSAILREVISVAGGRASGREGQSKARLYKRYVVAPEPEKDAVDTSEALALLGEDADFAGLVARWFSLIEKIRSSVRMVTGLSYVSDGYLEGRLVTAVSAAEGLHRSLYRSTAMTKERFDALRSTATDGLVEEDAKWLRERLHNEPTLNDRLLDMVSRIESYSGSELPINSGRWAAQAKRARNALVHRDEAGSLARQLRRMDLHQLDAIVETTLLVVTVLVFVELQLDGTVIRDLPQGNSRMRMALWLASKHLVDES